MLRRVQVSGIRCQASEFLLIADSLLLIPEWGFKVSGYGFSRSQNCFRSLIPVSRSSNWIDLLFTMSDNARACDFKSPGARETNFSTNELNRGRGGGQLSAF